MNLRNVGPLRAITMREPLYPGDVACWWATLECGHQRMASPAQKRARCRMCPTSELPQRTTPPGEGR